MRREARIKAMEILYSIDFNGCRLEDAIHEDEDALAIQLASFCYENLSLIDGLISSHLKNYTLDRLNLVDKAIIRLAVSEMLGDEPRQVIINEALELTKAYSDSGDHKAVSFNNRLLDDINKDLKK